MDNIYANYGNIIDYRYVSRRQAERELKKVLEGERRGCVSLVGMQRTGKSSILHHVFLQKDVVNEMLCNQVLVVNVSMASLSRMGAGEFFRTIVKRTYKALCRIGSETSGEGLSGKYKAALSWSAEAGSVRAIADYLEALHDMGFCTIVAADEFDNATEIFKEYPQCFGYLWELLYGPDAPDKYGLDLITASRRSLEEILDGAVQEASGNMTRETASFREVVTAKSFKPIHIGPLSGEEWDDYRKIFIRTYGEDVLKEKRREWAYVEKVTGRMAYWADLLMYFRVQKLCEGKADVRMEDIYGENENAFFGLYQLLLGLLQEQGLLEVLLRHMFDPGQNVSEDDFKKLKAYGIIRERGQGQMEVFSEGFWEYLRIRQSGYQFAPLWNQVELGIRRALLWHLKTKYQGEWEQKLRMRYGGSDSRVNLAKAYGMKRKKEQDLEKELIAQEITVLDMLSTEALFRIVGDEWEKDGGLAGMKEIFPGIGEWEKISRRLCLTRFGYDHNVSQILSLEDRAQNNFDLQEILSHLGKWEEAANG